MCEPSSASQALDSGEVNCTASNEKMSAIVKKELKDCVICSNRDCEQWHDLLWSETIRGQTSLVTYVCRVADVRLSAPVDTTSAVVCEACFDLVNLLERAEIEYYRLKENFVAIIASNSFFEKVDSENKKNFITVTLIKNEVDGLETPSIDLENQNTSRTKVSNSPTLKKKRGRKPGKRKKQEIKDSDPEDDATLSQLKQEIQPQRSPESTNDHDDTDENLDWTDAPFVYEPEQAPVKTTRSTRTRKIKENCENNSIDQPPCDESDIKNLNEIDTSNLLVPITKGNVTKKERRNFREKKKNYTCDDCHAVFSNYSRFKFHLRKHESSLKPPFICEICGAHYKKKKACDIHVAMHKGIGDWKCEECDRLFPSKAALNRHNNIHTGTPNYQCDLCGKSFIHTSSFKMHKLSHTGVKPHPCDICGLRLLTKSHLKRHKRIHTGEKRHECTSCGKKFSERYNLLSHQKSHEQENAPKTPKPRTWNGFRCNLCEKRFERRYILEKHLEVAHQWIMERGPPKPRNTMTKLLKAQAAAVGKLSVRTDLAVTSDGVSQQEGNEETAPSLKTVLDSKDAENASQSTSSNVEDASEDVKPEKSNKAKNDAETASSSDRTSTYEAYDALRSANGVWPPNLYIPAEYIRSLPELQQ